MSTDTCNTCEHYQQHYTFNNSHIFQVYCGHCTFLKIKSKKPDSKICENYLPSDPDDTTFVSKEYLSKSLLEYVLSLELLPKIQNTGEQTEHSQCLFDVFD